MSRTGNTNGHWTEYSETPPGHATGYFWMRTDGLRFGLRTAGNYYRPGTTHEPVNAPYHPLDLTAEERQRRGWTSWPNGSYFDGAMAFDVLGAAREEGKMERLPTHLRVMRGGQEIELISKVDGVDLKAMLRREDFDPWAFIDARYPIDRTVDARR